MANQLAFSWIRALPGGWRFSNLIPGIVPKPGGSTFWQRVISDFDNLSPEFAHSHAPEEVRQWFLDIGFRDVEILDFPTAVTGFRKSQRERDKVMTTGATSKSEKA